MSDQELVAPQPTMRFPEFADTGEWRVHQIGDFLVESREKGSKGDTARKLTVKLWGNGVHEKQEALKGSINTQYYRRTAGQFIYSKLDFLNQAFGVIPQHLDGLESTIDLPCFDVSPELNSTFLLEYVLRGSFYKRFGEVADGGRKAKRIQQDVFLAMPIVLPPSLEEQNQIENAFLSFDEVLEAERAKGEGLRNQKAGLVRQLFPARGEAVPQLRFKRFSDAPAWREAVLSDVSSMQAGTFLPASEIGDEPKQDRYPCYGANGLRGYAPTYTHRGEYSLIGRQGALCGNVTMAKGEFYATEHAVVVSAKSKTNRSWLHYLLDFMNLNQHATGQAQPGLSVTTLQQLPILHPHEDEQRLIAELLSTIDDLIYLQQKKVACLEVQRSGLLQLLFPVFGEVAE